ncbi:PepSY-associated TM helix domain-containing protein [Aliarcobacter lanthieri]|uniref:PepSY-associated TM helix domain-containing protein n=1 Tax=Aliarcobacter lanthieri TaxID=1355374 RepID=UPI003AAE7035
MSIEQSYKKEDEKLFKQRLERVHVAIGISFSFLMYVALFFGVFAILLPYIENWEKPSTHIKIADISTVDYDKTVKKIIDDPDYPKVNPISISLPGAFENPLLRVSTQFVKSITFNPNTNEEVIREGNLSELAWFLNSMHYGRPLGDLGWYSFGIMAVAGMFLMLGGLIQILIIKYQNGGKSVASKFSKWHRKILIWTLLPFFFITLTGALLNIGNVSSSLMTYISTKGETSETWKLRSEVLYPKDLEIELTGIETPIMSLNELVKKAQEINPDLSFQSIKITNYGDSSVRVKFSAYNPYMPFLNGVSNRPYIILNGVDGSLIEEKRVLDKHWASMVYDSLFFLHYLNDVDTFTRLVVLFLMILTAIAIGFGNMLYFEKKARKFGDNIPIYQGFGKLSLAVMVGVILATGLLFVLQWLLPFDMENRVLIQKGLFAVAWIATLTWSFYRLNSYKAAKEFLYLGGILFILSPIIHFINSGFSPIRLWNEEVYTVLSVDIGLFIFGLILLVVAYKLPVDRQRIQEFWTRRGVK